MDPQISIIMPTHNRSALLQHTLGALARQTVSPEAFEVVLVADGCRDDTLAVAQSLELPYRFTVIDQFESGAAAARNRGSAAAAAPLLLFLDDDMEAAPGMVAAHLAAHEAHPGGVVLGYFPLVEPLGLSVFQQSNKRWWDNLFNAWSQPDHRFTFRDFCTGNVSLPRDVFERAEGFDIRFHDKAGEDHDLGFRLLQQGVRFHFAREAASSHRDVPSLANSFRRAAAEGRGHVLLAQKHPAIVTSLLLGQIAASPLFRSLWHLIWMQPALATLVAALVRVPLYLGGLFRQPGLWQRGYGFLHDYFYWCGVRDELGSLPRFRQLVGRAPATSFLRDPQASAVRSIDLCQPLEAIADVTAYARVRLYVMQNDCPRGSVEIVNHYQPMSVAQLHQIINDHFPARADTTTVGHAPALPVNVTVSVVVATYDRPDDLRVCLRSLLAQRSPRPIEIVVVDNHPTSGLTPPVAAEFPEIVLVNEPRVGLAYARNAGFSASAGAIVVATDDDVHIPPTWLEKLLAPFARPEVMATTGNVLPLELETRAQRLFETYGGLGRGFARKVADLSWFRQFEIAVPTWHLGATANAAFRAAIFNHPQIGLMDEALGPGMPSGVGEDAYLFYKILKAGYTIVYEPSAYVWHKHRRSMEALRGQLYNYSKGHVAYHLTTWGRDGDRRALTRLARDLPVSYFWRLREWRRDRHTYPLSLILLEMAGSLAGPWSLWQSRRRVRREGHSRPYGPSSQIQLHPKPLTTTSAPSR